MEVTNFQRFGRTTFDLSVRLGLAVRLVRLGWSRCGLVSMGGESCGHGRSLVTEDEGHMYGLLRRPIGSFFVFYADSHGVINPTARRWSMTAATSAAMPLV
jgi:hypothetical protein